jgi:AbrB family looped-hinge helix DNA binding protein
MVMLSQGDAATMMPMRNLHVIPLVERPRRQATVPPLTPRYVPRRRDEAGNLKGARSLYKRGRNSYIVSMKTTVSEKGQITIPKLLRDRLGIRPGQVLEMREENGRLVATKATQVDPVESVYGILQLDRPTDQLVALLRGESDDDIA